MRLYTWFAGTTSIALSEKTRQLMAPNPVKREHEIADALEKWSEQERTVRAHGDKYALPAVFKVTALRILMTCKLEQFELLEREAKAKHNGEVCDTMFDDLYAKVREYANHKRLEEITRKTRGDPMDIGQLKQDWDEWYQEDQEWRTHENYGLDALGKGKGLSK